MGPVALPLLSQQAEQLQQQQQSPVASGEVQGEDRRDKELDLNFTCSNPGATQAYL